MVGDKLLGISIGRPFWGDKSRRISIGRGFTAMKG